ncbi:hypothetical protein S83_066459 [Arachis hypogaea]
MCMYVGESIIIYVATSQDNNPLYELALSTLVFGCDKLNASTNTTYNHMNNAMFSMHAMSVFCSVPHTIKVNSTCSLSLSLCCGLLSPNSLTLLSFENYKY